MKRNKQIGLRVNDEELHKLNSVANSIASNARGMKPDITEIIRSVMGWGNKKLVSPEERAFLAGETKEIQKPSFTRKGPKDKIK